MFLDRLHMFSAVLFHLFCVMYICISVCLLTKAFNSGTVGKSCNKGTELNFYSHYVMCHVQRYLHSNMCTTYVHITYLYGPTFSITAGREKCILVAHDYGGAIAWNFVMSHPEMLDSYIILDAPYSPSNFRILTSNLFQVFMSWYAFTILLLLLLLLLLLEYHNNLGSMNRIFIYVYI